jgi:predicted nucleotidyltransferase
MRLSTDEIEFIKNKIKEYIENAEIYIFGSILDDSIKGGDVDIYIITDKKLSFEDRSFLKFELENYLYRPVDLVFHKDFNLAIEIEAIKGVKIN